jgi:hypothetical protein
MFGISKLICYTKRNNCFKNKTQLYTVKKNLFESFFWLKILCVLIGISSFCQHLNAKPISPFNSDYASSSTSALPSFLGFPLSINENGLFKAQPNLNSQQQKAAIKIDENTILFETLGNSNNNTPERLKSKPKRKQKKYQGQNSQNAKTSDSNSKNAFFSFNADMASRLQRQNEVGKGDDTLGFSSSSSSNSRKIFKADKTLQRLEKKSWKIPIKSIVLYSESSNSNAKVASKFGQLTDAFDLIKDS